MKIPKNSIIIDFYNVTTTIIEAIQGYPVFRGTDYIIRDNAKAEGRSKKPLTKYLEATKIIRDYLARYDLNKILLVGDKQLPFSKQTLSMATNILREKTDTYYILSEQADKEIISKSRDYIVSTSDCVILEKTARIYDLAGEIILNYPKPLTVVELWAYVT